jgi:hypothetical protein
MKRTIAVCLLILTIALSLEAGVIRFVARQVKKTPGRVVRVVKKSPKATKTGLKAIPKAVW